MEDATPRKTTTTSLQGIGHGYPELVEIITRAMLSTHTVTLPQSSKVGYFDMARLPFPLTTSAVCFLFSHLLLPRTCVIASRLNLRIHCHWHHSRAVRPILATRQASKMSSSTRQRDPLLGRLPGPVAVPAMLLQPGVKQLAAPVQISPTPSCPPPSFIKPHFSTSKRKRPQCIAHRGYKAKYPENTLSAFRAAINAGAHAVETDLHITKDEIIVLSHDANLKRCFGEDIKIADKTWDEIKDLRTIQKPHERIPRLADLLQYLAEEGREHVWVFLDIKLGNDADDIMRLIASTLSSNPPQTSAPWNERIILGLWAAKYLSPAQQYLPGFPMMHIAFSATYARQFFDVANVGFNMMFYALLMPGGRRFLRDAQHVYKRKVLSWTINSEDHMKWCIRRGLDGVVTDEVEKYLDVAERFDEDQEKEPYLPVELKVLWAAFKSFVWVKILLVFYSGKMQLGVPDGFSKKKAGKQ